MSVDNRQSLEAASWLAVVRAYQECNRRYAVMLDHFELTIPQFDVLSAIRRHDPQATPRQIANDLVVTRGNITGLLHRLQDRGLVRTREHETDGRSFYCDLTPSGRRLLDEARGAASRFVAYQLSDFSDDELRHTRDSMTKMQAHLHTLDPDAIATGHSPNEQGRTKAHG